MDMSDALRATTGGADMCAYSEKELARNINGRNWVKYQSRDKEYGERSFGLTEMREKSCDSRRLKLEWHEEYG